MAVGPRSLLDALKQARPTTVRAHLADDSTREIAVPSTRQKWQHVERVLEGMPWQTLDMLDHKGKLVGPPWVNDGAGPAGDLEDIGAGGSKRVGELAQLAGIFLRAQDMVLQRHNEAMRPVLDANRIMLADLTTQLVELRKETAQSIQRERELMMALADTARGEDGELDLPKLAPLLLPMLAGLTPQRPPVAPSSNGTQKATPPNGKPSGAPAAAAKPAA